MNQSTLALEGAYTALITPFTASGSSVDVERLQLNIEEQSLAGVTGVVPCGTTGETPTLSDGEYRLVIEKTVESARSRQLQIIPGAGSNSTAHALELHSFVHSVRADAALHVTPYYNKPSQEGLYRHYMTLADSCDLPIVLYNIPGRAGVEISAETLSRLAEHPNIVAVKDATGSLSIAQKIASTNALTVLSGDDPLTLPLATVGGKGVISVASNVVPDRVAAMCNAFLSDDWENAQAMNISLTPLAQALLTLDSNPVPLKTLLSLLGRDSGAVRLPLCPPDAQVTEQIRTLVTTYQLSSSEIKV